MLTVYYTIQEISIEQFGNDLLLDTPEAKMVKALHNSLTNILDLNERKLKMYQAIAARIHNEVRARIEKGNEMVLLKLFWGILKSITKKIIKRPQISEIRKSK